MTKMLFILLFALFSQPVAATISSTPATEQSFDPSHIYVVYSNLFVAERTDYPMSISLTFRGPFKQIGWLVLTSPWKPLLIISNNTDQSFIELTYNPQQTVTNPISNTSHTFAWDYDVINNVIFIKFLTTFTVTVSIQFGIPSIIKFWASKQTYATSETVEAAINVYGNYAALLSMKWIAKIAVKDIVNNTVKTVDQEFQLSQNETKQLTFSLGTFDEGIYNVEAQIIDPRTTYALTMEQLTFEVKKLEPSSIIPLWAPWILLASAIITIAIVKNLYRRRKRGLFQKVRVT